MLNCFDFCLTVSRSIVDFLCTDQDTVALWEVHQRIKDYPSKQDQSNFQKTEWCQQKYLLHENSTGKADRLANGGHHQAVIHPCLLKPEIIFQSCHFCFHIWQRSDEKADYGLLWKACTFYNNHHCHHDSRHDDDHHYLLSYDDHWCHLGSSLLASKPPTLPGARFNNGTKPVTIMMLILMIMIKNMLMMVCWDWICYVH